MSKSSQKPAPPLMILACSGASNVGQHSMPDFFQERFL